MSATAPVLKPPKSPNPGKTDSLTELHTDANGGKAPTPPPLAKRPALGKDDNIPRLADGWPDHKQIPDVFDYLAALTPEQWDAGLPVHLRVDCYLYRLNPKVPWSTQDDTNQYVTKPRHAIDEDWIASNWGGHVWRIRVKRGIGDQRKDIYNQTVQVAAAPRDLPAVLATQGISKGGTAPAAPGNGGAPGVVAAAPAGQLEVLERMFNKFLEERQGLNPMIEAQKIVEAQREMLKHPVVEAKPEGISMLDMMKMLRDEREATMTMMEKIYRREAVAAAPVAAPSFVEQLTTFATAFRSVRDLSEDFSPAAVAPGAPAESTAVSLAKTIFNGLGPALEKGGEFLDKAAALQRSRNAAGGQPPPPVIDGRNPAYTPTPPAVTAAPTTSPVDAADAPAGFAIRKTLIARLVVNMFPREDNGKMDPYEGQGVDAAELANDTDPEVANWLADHFAKGESRPVDAIIDPIFVTVMNHPNMMEFGTDYIGYFIPPPPEGEAAATAGAPA